MPIIVIAILALTVIDTVYVFAQDPSKNLIFSVNVESSAGSFSSTGTYNQTDIIYGNVGKMNPGQSVVFKIFKNNVLLGFGQIPAYNITSDGAFHYKINVAGHFPSDVYKIDFVYNSQMVEETLPILPPDRFGPIIISQVELWGPTSFYADGVKLCVYNETRLGPWTPAWIELRNTKNETITTDGFDLTMTQGGGIGSYQLPITLGPHQYCYLQTADRINTRVGVGGSLGNDAPPHEDSTVTLGYSIQTYKGKVSYRNSTPELSDNFADKRTWQLVDGKWVFKEVDIKHEFPFKTTLMSPIQQFNWWVTFKDIQCKEGLMVFVKIGDFPLCLTPHTASVLEKRGWGVPEQTIPIENTNYTVSYSIFGGKVDRVISDFQTRGLTLYLNAENDGRITLFLPRSFTDTSENMDYTEFDVKSNGKKIDYDQRLTPTDRMFKISFKSGTERIEIIPRPSS